MTSFSEAVTRRNENMALDTRTGEMFDPVTADHESLVEIFLALENGEKQFKKWRTAVEDELVRRHGDRRAAQVVGDHEIDIDRTATRAWDIDDLEAVIDDLEARGLVDIRDVQGLIRKKREVNGTAAKRLIDHADGDVLIELSRCFSWKKGRAKVKVTPVATLEP